MAYTFKVTKKNECQILLDGEIVDTVGPWGDDGAAAWGQAVCDKYNAPEYADTPYPNELPTPEPAVADQPAV